MNSSKNDCIFELNISLLWILIKTMRQFIFTIFAICSSLSVFSQTKGVLTKNTGVADGYTLFTPLATQETYLIDNCGRLLKEWSGTNSPSMHAELTNEGKLLRLERAIQSTFTQGGIGGKLTELSWDGSVLNTYLLEGPDFCQHHDFEILPNGNLLVLVSELKTDTEAIAEGRDPSTLTDGELWPEAIYEYELFDGGTFNIVWKWHSWDHLIQDIDPTKPNFGAPNGNRSKIDLNYSVSGGKADFMHANSVDYNPNTDEIIISVKAFDEVWVIDHSTTEIEASGETGGNAGKGGDLLYRWGNPSTYNSAVDPTKIYFHGQHDARWLLDSNYPERSFTVFNNQSGTDYSSFDLVFPEINVLNEYESAQDYFLPDTLHWRYTAPIQTDLFSQRISGGQLMDNGHFLICSGNQGYFVEVDTLSTIYWEYSSPVTPNNLLDQHFIGNASNNVFRANYYPLNFDGFVGKVITAGDVLELNPTSNICDGANLTEEKVSTVIYPNPSNGEIAIESNDSRITHFSIYSLDGKVIQEQAITSNNVNLNSGIYLIAFKGANDAILSHSKIIIRK